MIIAADPDAPPAALERSLMMACGLFPDDRLFAPVPVAHGQEGDRP